MMRSLELFHRFRHLTAFAIFFGVFVLVGWIGSTAAQTVDLLRILNAEDRIALLREDRRLSSFLDRLKEVEGCTVGENETRLLIQNCAVSSSQFGYLVTRPAALGVSVTCRGCIFDHPNFFDREDQTDEALIRAFFDAYDKEVARRKNERSFSPPVELSSIERLRATPFEKLERIVFAEIELDTVSIDSPSMHKYLRFQDLAFLDGISFERLDSSISAVFFADVYARSVAFYNTVSPSRLSLYRATIEHVQLSFSNDEARESGSGTNVEIYDMHAENFRLFDSTFGQFMARQFCIDHSLTEERSSFDSFYMDSYLIGRSFRFSESRVSRNLNVGIGHVGWQLSLRDSDFGADVSIASHVGASRRTVFGDLQLRDIAVGGDLSLQGVHAKNEIVVEGLSVAGGFNLRDAYSRSFQFVNTERRSEIRGRADLRFARFGHVHMEEVDFGGPADFSNVYFGRNPTPENLGPVWENQSDPFNRCLPKRPARTLNLSKEGSVTTDTPPSVSEGQPGTTYLRNVDFRDTVSLQGSEFAGPFGAYKVRFRSELNIKDVRFFPEPKNTAWRCSDSWGFDWNSKRTFFLEDVSFRTIRGNGGALPDHEYWILGGSDAFPSSLVCNGEVKILDGRPVTLSPPSVVLSRIEGIFEESRELKSRNEVFVLRQRLSNAQYYRDWREALAIASQPGSDVGKWLLAVVSGVLAVWGGALDVLWGVPTLYSTDLPRTTAFAALVLGIATCVNGWFAYRGWLIREAPKAAESSFTLSLRFLELPHNFMKSRQPTPYRPGNRLADAALSGFLFSWMLLIKVGTRSVHLDVDNGDRWLPWLVRIQWAFGYYLLLLVATTLASTQPFLNALLLGLF